MIGRRFLSAWPYALLSAIYLSSSPYYAGLNNPNEMARVYMSEAWVSEGHFQLDGVMRRWGFVNDEAKRGGHYYAGKAPLQSLVGGPALILSRATLKALGIAATKQSLVFALRLFGSTLFGLGFSMLLLWWLRRRAVELGAPEAAGTALGLSLGLGTMLLPYSITFTGHVLAAASAGMCALVAFALPRTRPGGARWRTLGAIAGFFGGACPFAEYPAALVAAPMLFAALWQTKAGKRAELLGFMALGGALPFGLGLWSHQALWGSPFLTAYSFLNNRSYAQLVEGGFFGSKLPHLSQAYGALLSPETGLFFFSPVLLIGLFALIRATRGRSAQLKPIAWMSVLAVFASFYFISAYPGWRGGWTLGPRYIISMAPLLGLWAGEALGLAAARAPLAATGVVSVLVTGPAAVLYPHLSDVYQNPLKSFVLPFYAAGYAPYGLAHWAGLSGWAANAPTLLSFAAAAGFIGLSAVVSWRRRLLGLAAALGLWAILIGATPERRAPAAAESRRLAKMWEPKPN